MAGSDEAGGGRGRRREITLRRGGELIVGRLEAHGVASYQFREKEDPSYYLKLVTSRGERTLWGKDLERAVLEGEAGQTRPKVGDLVGARRVAREAVTVAAKERDSDGRVIAQREHHAHRTRWVVEKVSFFAERARLARRLREEQVDIKEAVRERPELRSAFLSLRAAEEFARKRIGNAEDRERFLEMVKGAMASSIRRGEPLPSVSLREKSQNAEEPKRPPEREEPTR